MEPAMSRPVTRTLAEGALFQLAFTAIGIATLQRWARLCEARRRRPTRRPETLRQRRLA
jgi:hypothetical protein